VQALLDGMILEYVVSGGSLRRADAQQRVRFVLDAVMAPQVADVHPQPAVSR
jgi:hypothetical protein